MKLMGLKRYRFIFAACAASYAFVPRAAFANCPMLQKGLDSKMQEYRTYRDDNETKRKKLAETEDDCKITGKQLSSRISAQAESLSCESQADAEKLHDELGQVGSKCNKNFAELHELQVSFRKKFEKVKHELDDAHEGMKVSKIVKNIARRS